MEKAIKATQTSSARFKRWKCLAAAACCLGLRLADREPVGVGGKKFPAPHGAALPPPKCRDFLLASETTCGRSPDVFLVAEDIRITFDRLTPSRTLMVQLPDYKMHVCSL